MNLRFTLLTIFVLSVFRPLVAEGFSIRGTTDKEVAIYEPGEPMVFTLRVFEEDQPVSGKQLVWTRSGDDGITETGEGVAGIEGLKVTTQMDTPGFVRLRVLGFESDGSELEGFIKGWGADEIGQVFFDGGACVEPEKLQPVEEPDDFDAFWAGMKAKGEAVPLEAARTELKSPNPNVKLYAVKVNCAGSKPVTGYLSIPENAGPASLPAICQFQGYGVRKHEAPGWVSDQAIVFNVNAHGMELGKENIYYDQLKKELKGYAFDEAENSDPETAYFHDMSLRVLRAFEYVKSLPEWNGRDLESYGGSQGGTQGLWGAGLDPDVSTCNIWSPWCCDMGGSTKGRMKGWRPEYTDALAYYDPVFHARRIQGTVHLIANFGDYTCTPSSVWIVYNEVPHSTKSMEVKQGCTHSYTMKPHMSFTVTPQGIQNVGVK